MEIKRKIQEYAKNGKPYDDMDENVVLARNNASKKYKKYNHLVNTQDKYDQSILKELFESLGENVFIESNFRCEFGFNISFGSNVYANYDLIILDRSNISIGNDVYIGPRVRLYCTNHAENPRERAEHVVYSKPITIEDNVWLGANTCVL